MEADQMTRGQLEAEFSALARTMYFTGSTVAAFAKGATRGQLAAVCDLIRSENATREENRKARPVPELVLDLETLVEAVGDGKVSVGVQEALRLQVVVGDLVRAVCSS